MHLIMMTCLAMVAFAANSILNRWGVAGGYISPQGFAVVRVVSGAICLLILLKAQGKGMPGGIMRRAIGAGALATYLIGFSLAYQSLDAGLGALVLFGVVQITMFLWPVMRGRHPGGWAWLGMAAAFAGLVLALAPVRQVHVDPFGIILMVLAGLGWGIYSLAGRAEADALAATTANFVYAIPLVALLIPFDPGPFQPIGIGLAMVSGAITSGLGYALWYRVVPQLAPSSAGIVQLSVPIIAILAGAALLHESLTSRALIGTVLVLGGIFVALTGRKSG